MLCQKCGAINDNNNWRCRSCNTVLQERKTAVQAPGRVIQSPLKQAQPSNITTVGSPSFYQKTKTERQTPESNSINDHIEKDQFTAQPSPGIKTETPTFAQQQPAGYPGTKSKTIFLMALAIITILGAGTTLYLFLTPEGTNASFFFAEAEKKFNDQNYSTALAMYHQFVNEYPEDYLVPLAHTRIKSINDQFLFEKQQREQQIQELVLKANEAFRKQRYLKPKNDNVLLFTSELLELDPANSTAMELQALVIRYYEDKAESARKRGYYNTAIHNYQNILNIMPNDTATQEKLDAMLAKTGKKM